jgi:hypothetical protein
VCCALARGHRGRESATGVAAADVAALAGGVFGALDGAMVVGYGNTAGWYNARAAMRAVGAFGPLLGRGSTDDLIGRVFALGGLYVAQIEAFDGFGPRAW